MAELGAHIRPCFPSSLGTDFDPVQRRNKREIGPIVGACEIGSSLQPNAWIHLMMGHNTSRISVERDRQTETEVVDWDCVRLPSNPSVLHLMIIVVAFIQFFSTSILFPKLFFVVAVDRFYINNLCASPSAPPRILQSLRVDLGSSTCQSGRPLRRQH